MENVINEITDEKSIEKALAFIFLNFKSHEKDCYSRQELVSCERNLKEFDVFNAKDLKKLIERGEVCLYTSKTDREIDGVVAMSIKTGRILFLDAKQSDSNEKRLLDLVEKMVELRIDSPDNRLQILAFLGQLPTLKKIGFVRLFDEYIINHGIKFVPMQYNYTQIDSEI